MMTHAAIGLRLVIDEDLPVFFEHQRDPQAVYMAAFTARDPEDRSAFNVHWLKIRNNLECRIRTIIFETQVAGYVSSYETDGQPEVTYWINRKFWGKGLATLSLQKFLKEVDIRRPMLARAAKDNFGSVRVLEKCGFQISGESSGFANGRGRETAEWLFQLS